MSSNSLSSLGSLWDDRAMVRRLFGLLVPFLGSAAAVYLSTRVFDQDRFDRVVSLQVTQGDLKGTAQTIAIVTVIFGLVNLIVKPVVRFFTFPIRILTFGLFSLIINAGLLLLTGYVAERVNAPFHVKLSPWVIAAAAFIGIAAGIFNWLGDKITSLAGSRRKVVERVVERPAPQLPPRTSDPWQGQRGYQPPPAQPQQYPPAPPQQYPPAPPQQSPPATPYRSPQQGGGQTYGSSQPGGQIYGSRQPGQPYDDDSAWPPR